MKLFTSFIVIVFIISACNRYPGYRKLTPEIYYSLIQFGDKGKKTFSGDFVTIHFEYRTCNDSVFFSGIRKVKVNEPSDDASVDHCFLKMNQNDSASFIIPAIKFFSGTLNRSLPDFISAGDMMKLNIRMLEIQSEKDFQSEKQLFLTWSAELSEYESVILKKFLKEEKPGISAKPEGFYIINLNKGNDRKINKGDHIWVHYEGKFLNGKYFDGTYRSRDPVDFIYGTEFVLISGLEQALAYMSEGEKAMIILPSSLAFGEKGDNFGIIPPYTSLVYTLEVIKME